MSRTFILFFLCAVLPATVRGEEFRTFTTAEAGSKVVAAFVKIEKGDKGVMVVVLKRKADSMITRVPLNKLAAWDRSYVLAADAAQHGPPFLRPRMLPATREAAVQSAGAAPAAVENAVEEALAWLAKKQQADGSWGPPGLTGLVLLAFAGHGCGPASAPYGDRIKRGVEFLLTTAQKNVGDSHGCFSNFGSACVPHEHAVATQALAEIYALSQFGASVPPGLKEALSAAESMIVKHQHKTGDWGFDAGFGSGSGYSWSTVNDYSVSVWQVHALCACRDATTASQDNRKSLKLAMEFFIQGQDRTSGTSGEAKEEAVLNRWNATGGVLTALQAIGREKGKLRKGLSWLSGTLEAGTLKWNSDCDTAVWYFDSLALCQGGSETLPRYRDYVAALLPAQNQIADTRENAGSWKSEESPRIRLSELVDGNWNREISRTAFAVLILEAPYRCRAGDTK